ncbi:hypothetical protein ARSEF1564_003160 [Beauveria bassiana]
MDHDYLLSEFDRLVSEGVVLYDDKQTILHQQDGGLTIDALQFQFVLTSALNKKPTAATAGEQSKELVEKSVRPGSDIDTNGYEIGHVGGSHVLVANKFCYARPHYLLLTEDGYARQYEPLNRSDLAAAWALLSSRGNDKLSLPSVRAESGANAMGMLGYIAVSSKADIDNWTDQGLCKLLRQLGVPK